MNKTVKKALKWTVLGIVALIVIVIVLALIFIDPIARKGVEKGASYALGVPTKLDKLNLSLRRGDLAMDGMTVNNAPGFQDPTLMNLKHFAVGVNTGSLLSDTVQLRNFELDGLDVYIEQNAGGSNISAIMDNLKKFESKEPKQKSESGKKVKIDKITIKNVTAHVRMLGSGSVKIEVPQIVLTDVKSEDGGGVVVGEVVSQMFTAIVAKVVEAGRGILSSELATNLSNSVSNVTQAMGKNAQELFAKTVPNFGKAVTEDVKKGLEKTGETFKKTEETFKGLFGTTSKPAPKP